MKYSEVVKTGICGYGSTAICYLLDDNRVFKEFAKPLPGTCADNYRHLINLHNKSFRFPVEFVFDDTNNFCGYIMGYANGLTLRSTFKSSDLNKMSINTISFENEIKNVSKKGIKFRDFHSDNIIYNNEFIVVDTDSFIKSDEDTDLLIYENVTYYKEVLYNLLTENLNKFKYSDCILDRSKEYMALKHITSGEMIYSVLNLLKNKYKDSSIKSINDIDESYKKRK